MPNFPKYTWVVWNQPNDRGFTKETQRTDRTAMAAACFHLEPNRRQTTQSGGVFTVNNIGHDLHFQVPPDDGLYNYKGCYAVNGKMHPTRGAYGRMQVS